jgi:hypothetical protein
MDTGPCQEGTRFAWQHVHGPLRRLSVGGAAEQHAEPHLENRPVARVCRTEPDADVEDDGVAEQVVEAGIQLVDLLTAGERVGDEAS